MVSPGNSISEVFEWWKEEADQSDLPSFILSIIDTPARDLYYGSIPNRLSANSTISEVMEAF
jgi:hypothetical protein